MEPPLVFFMVLVMTTFAAANQKIYASENPILVGSNVTLFSQQNITTGAWLFDTNIIVFILPGSPVITDAWRGRVTFNPTMSSLTIRSLLLGDSGLYTLQGGTSFHAQLTLSVQAPVTMAAIRIVGAPPILNHTFTLTCETAGSVDWIAWMHGWNPLYPDNTTHFSADNSTLTFAALMTSDIGDYRCVASNPFSNLSSQVFKLELYYGPQMPTIKGPSVAKTGYNVTFGCYASSNPPSSYKWYFNHSLVANTSMYVTPPLTMDMSGMYTCMAFNNVTGENRTAYTMLTVYDPIEHVQVESPMTPAMEGHIYNLTCNVTGPVGHVYWMKNGGRLHGDNRTVFSMDNRTVTFHPLKHHDTGYYQCVAANAAWNVTSARYMLLVIFGPETPVIDGPAFAESGHYAVFRCLAASVPPSHFSWWFNGSIVANSSVFTTDPLTLNMSGEYTCMAYNNVTGNTSTSSKMLTVVEAIQSVVIRNHTVPINSENFTLTCDVTGPYDAIYWMKDDMHLNVTHANHHMYYANHHMYYAIENGTLRFTPVTLHNDGTYQCVATNQAAAHESPEYMLLVNYGPLSVNISGPDSMAHGLSVTLTCSADSRPDCDFHWFFNDQSRAMGSVIDFLATEENEGNYTCKARNPVTNITMYKTKAFTVAAHASALHLHHGGLMLMGLSVAVLFT